MLLNCYNIIASQQSVSKGLPLLGISEPGRRDMILFAFDSAHGVHLLVFACPSIRCSLLLEKVGILGSNEGLRCRAPIELIWLSTTPVVICLSPSDVSTLSFTFPQASMGISDFLACT
ncbi:hypothetical protein EV44_g1954 [Erysiphe necator]|uniref:Uncharacterized protein n=1 Tax=Uncinula necator TaxID=52586 RepID=A0A0B1P110_UNCNE|nr:hypothetical protein EV44_g1954 [Erysiphe necator]